MKELFSDIITSSVTQEASISAALANIPTVIRLAPQTTAPNPIPGKINCIVVLLPTIDIG